MGHLGVFLFCSCGISLHFFRKNKLTLFFTVYSREVIESIVDMYDFSDHAVCFLSNRPFGGVLTDRLYELRKRFSGMDPAACDFKIPALFGKFVVDMVSICDSGSGKTTAIDILLGLLEPQGGRVLADGVDIRDDYSSWLSHLGYIPQMIFMLDDTIRANMAFGISGSEVDDAQVWKALEEAQLKEFVQSLPGGLDTTIGERGVRLSGGQRQRIGIARALYTDPELLIFDEATSALDNETEAAIMESINALHGRKTLIIIAHRLTTIEECDMVYRVENGQIVQER